MNCKKNNCCELNFVLDYEEVDFSIGMCYTIIRGDVYYGEYEVTPKVVAQYLYTKEKTMLKDVTVYEIPYVETSNQYGTTVSIAS